MNYRSSMLTDILIKGILTKGTSLRAMSDFDRTAEARLRKTVRPRGARRNRAACSRKTRPRTAPYVVEAKQAGVLKNNGCNIKNHMKITKTHM